MAEQQNPSERTGRGCMLHNWVEEVYLHSKIKPSDFLPAKYFPVWQRAVAPLDTQRTRLQILKQGHGGILTMDLGSKMETVTTLKASYVPPKGPVVRLRGIRGELLEKHIAEMMRDEVQAELNTQSPEMDYCSTTQKDFCVEGFVPLTPETTQVHDYKTDEAITFWSENYQRIQGVTAVQNPKAPFRKSALFSTPISERLDEIELPPDN